MKAPCLDKVTHLLKTAEETVNLSSALQQAVEDKITHKVRGKCYNVILKTAGESYSPKIRTWLP